MKQRHKVAVFGLLFVCMVLVLSPITAYAVGENPPGLSDVIKGQQQTTGQPATTQETPTNDTAPTQNTPPEQQPTQNTQPEQQPTQQPKQSTTEPYNGGLVDVGGMSGKDLASYSGISQDPEAQNAVQSTLGQIMGWVVPILVGVIFAALTLRVLLDILYIVAPFIRPKLAPGVQGDQMAENQMGGGMQYGMGGAGGMGMAGGMMGAGGMAGGMAGGYGGYGGYGRRGRRGMAGGMAGGALVGGTQWVSETAVAAVMAGNQVGPNGKPNNPVIFYLKGMVVPLVLIPVMLVLLLSGVLTQVGFYIGDLITNVISSRV